MKIQVAFIGAGLINQYCHIPSILDQKNIKLNSICDKDGYLLDKVSKKFLFENQYSNIDNLLNNNKIDALVLTVARKDTLNLLEKIYNKKKNIKILCEKPFGTNSKKAKFLINNYPSQINNTMIGYMKIYEPAVNDVTNIIKNKKYGDLLSLTIKNSMGDSYCNPFNYIKRKNLNDYKKIIAPKSRIHFDKYLNVFCHDFNLIKKLIGHKINIENVFINKSGIGRVNLSTNDIPISLDTSYNYDKEWYEVFKFNFSNAEIEIKFPPALLKNKLASLKVIEYNKNQKIIYKYKSDWAFRIQAYNFLKFIRGEINNPSNPVDACYDIELIEKIWKKI